VKSGEKLTVPFTRPLQGENQTLVNDSRISLGFWKDGLCDCCGYGLHPSFLNAFFCLPILTAQVMTRMKLDWLANTSTAKSVENTFKNITLIYVIYIILSFIFQDDKKDSHYGSVNTVFCVVNFCYTFFMIFIITKLRGYIRAKYQIPEVYCVGVEDCCCACFCAPCTVSQMARHTGNYESNSASCCSNTGLSKDETVLVV